jgi:hypothetical protein
MSYSLNKGLLWKQYALEVELFKKYLDITVKFNVFYYAATGAILSFYFSRSDRGAIRYSLLFPLIMSIAFGVVFIYGAYLLRILRKDIFAIRDELGFAVAPDANILIVLLYVFAGLMFVVAGVLAWLFYSPAV